MAKLPLEGLRILDMTVVWAGTYCTTLLADLGAEVIRIESIQTMQPITRGSMAHPSKTVIEGMQPFVAAMPDREPGQRPWNRYPLFNAHARNKLSMTVDLLRPEGMDIFKKLVKISDGFVENNVTETMDKLGISYETLQEQNPKLIMLRMPAYGNSGPYSNYRSLGVHMEGVIGHTLLRGYADRDPSGNTNVYAADAAGGVQGAFAVMAALHYRNRTGKGQLIELAQAENMVPYMGQFFMDYSMNGRKHSTIGNRHSTAIQGCYQCKGDDRWVNITISTDEQWQAFTKVAGLGRFVNDDRFATVDSRRAHHEEIDGYITQWTLELDHYEVMEALQRVGIAAGPVMDQRDAFNDPHLQARGIFEEASQEDVGTHLYTGAPYKMSETPIKIRRGPVQLGQDNEYVYKTLLQMSDEEYARLEREGHIGMDFADHVP
ncbi:MAG: CoA transferase [Chloroflexi bacterium]|nr:CoA transferase [Chloroflexota bacterium]MDA1227069.1 CoA transferase [Chloroflexota bacterium]